MKYEWRKNDKEIYMPGAKAVEIYLPKMKYITVEGSGNPNENIDFQNNIELLYSLSYAIRMMPKTGFTPEGYFEYVVYPLEGIWSVKDGADYAMTKNKDDFIYKIMIRQPDFVTEEIYNLAYKNVLEKKKINEEILKKAKFEEMEEGRAVQILHRGSFDTEDISFKKIEEYILENNLERISKDHKEIYLSDFRKTKEENLKTTLRIWIK